MNANTFVLSKAVSARVKDCAVGFATADISVREAVIALSDLLLEACKDKKTAYDAVTEIASEWSAHHADAVQKRTGVEMTGDAKRAAWSRVVKKVNVYREAVMLEKYVKPESSKPDAIAKRDGLSAGETNGKPKATRAETIAKREAEIVSLRADQDAAHKAGDAHKARKLELEAALLEVKTFELKEKEAAAKSPVVVTAAKRVAKAASDDAELAALLAWVLDNVADVSEFMTARQSGLVVSMKKPAARPSPAKKPTSVPVAKAV